MSPAPSNPIAEALDAPGYQRFQALAAMTDEEFRQHLLAQPSSAAAAMALHLLDRVVGYRRALDQATSHVADAGTGTSKAAAAKVAPSVGSLRAWVLAAIASRPSAQATVDQIEEATGLAGNTVRPRFVELRQGGYIERTGTTAPTRLGNEADLHRITDDGWRMLRSLRNAGDRNAAAINYPEHPPPGPEPRLS